MHASRTGVLSRASRGGRVRDTWATHPWAGGSPRKRGVIPHTRPPWWEGGGKARKRVTRGGARGRLASWGGNGSPRR